MANIKGVVNKINSRPVNTRNGEATAYSINVTFQDGSDQWYSAGFKKPEFREGSTVEFTAVQNGKYWNLEGAITVVKGESAPASNGSGGSSSPTAALNNRDKSITLQSASKIAADLLTGMIAADVLTFPKTKKDASQDLYLEMHKKIAYDLQAMFLEPDKHHPSNDVDDDDQDEGGYGEFDDEG